MVASSRFILNMKTNLYPSVAQNKGFGLHDDKQYSLGKWSVHVLSTCMVTYG